MFFILSSSGNESFSAYIPFVWMYSASRENSQLKYHARDKYILDEAALSGYQINIALFQPPDP